MKEISHTGAALTLVTFARYSLSYMQLPKTLPNVLSERLRASVVPSFLAFSKAAALPLQFSMCPYPISCSVRGSAIVFRPIQNMPYLVKCPVLQCHSHYHGQTQTYFPRLWIFVDLFLTYQPYCQRPIVPYLNRSSQSRSGCSE